MKFDNKTKTREMEMIANMNAKELDIFKEIEMMNEKARKRMIFRQWISECLKNISMAFCFLGTAAFIYLSLLITLGELEALIQ